MKLNLDNLLEMVFRLRKRNYFETARNLHFIYFALCLIDWASVVKAKLRAAISITSYKNSRDPGVLEYCRFNRDTFKNDGNGPERGMILTECSIIPQYIITNSFLLNKLAKKYNANIASYGITQRDIFSDCLYRSFGCHQHLVRKLTNAMTRERWQLFRQIIATIHTKEDLFRFKINDVWIGLDIYETILREGVPTVDLSSIRTLRHIFIALNYYTYFNDLLSSGIVKSVVLSHDNYVSMGLVAKIAYRYETPVFLANPLEIVRTRRTHHLYERFNKIPEVFDSLPEAEKNEGVLWAKSRLHQRLNGAVGVNMSYQVMSAFTTDVLPRQTQRTSKIKVVIATHCFFDNPHGLGWMLFVDFYEWLCYLGELANKTDYEWYIKPHRDYLPGTLEELNKIIEMYPRLRLVDPNTSWHQLKNEGVSVVLTCYGSIGHELPLLGYKVINAAYNPHIPYQFNWHPRTIEEYGDLLLNLRDLGDVQDIEKIYELFFVSKRILQQDDFLFKSYEQYLADSGGALNLSTYNVFLSQKDTFMRKANEKIDAFLSSDKDFSFEI